MTVIHRPRLTPAHRPSLLCVLRRKLNASCFPLEEAERIYQWATAASVGQLWDAIGKAERRIQGGVS